MNDDRQLLELAAKAAGVELSCWVEPEMQFRARCVADGWDKRWNPIDDDGDALRLAVKLELHNAVRNGYQHLDSDGDIYAATRRAIVRAAAQIGKEMA